MTDTLVLRPLRFRYPLQHREPAAGFAARLAMLNGRPMGQLLRDVYIQPFTIDKGKQAEVRKLAILGNADAEDLLRYTPHPATRERFHVVAGQTLGHHGVNRTYFRFCPHCVLEDIENFEGPIPARPWLRLEWTIAHFRSCDRHGTLLTATTPIRRRFEPFNFSETIEALLPDMKDMADQAQAHAAPSAFQDWLRSRLDGMPDPANWLNTAPLYAAAEFCEALGISALHPPKVKVEFLSEPVWATAADEGYRIASRGPEGIRTLLTKLNDAQTHTRGVWGPRDTFGYAYGLLQRTLTDPAYDTFRDVLSQFAIETMPLPAGSDVLGHIVEKQAVHTVYTAAKESGASPATIRRIFQRNGLGTERLTSGLRNHRVTISAEDIDDMVKQLKTAMTTPQVLKATGIPRMHFNAFVASGYMPTVTGTQSKANAKHRFDPAEVEAMMAKLFHGAVEVSAPTARQLPIIEARQVAVTTIESILAMIFEDKLTWKGKLPRRNDYGALLVDVDEITAHVRSGPKMVHLSRTEAMTFIPGFNRWGLDGFIEKGLLQTTMEFNPEARRDVPVITRQSAEQVRQNFVTLGELCQTSGLHPKQVKLLLRGVGIDPAYNAENLKMWVYDRRDVDRVVEERPDFWVYDKKKALEAATP